MALINSQIRPQAFEVIRDSIGAILALEIAFQGVNNWIPEAGWRNESKVWVERFIAFDKTEIPCVNVNMASGNFSNDHQGHSDGIYKWNIDCFAFAKTSDTDDGDKKSIFRLQRLMGVCRAILSNPQYKTLGIVAPYVMNRQVESIFIGGTDKDALSEVFGRLVLSVRVPENVDLLTPTMLALAQTQVKLELSDKGYFWSSETVDDSDGIFKTLIQQSNNGHPNIMLRLSPNNENSGVWAVGNNYLIGQYIIYPNDVDNPSPLQFKVIADHYSSAANKPINDDLTVNTTYWKLNIAPDMIQDSGDGVHFFRTTLQNAVLSQEESWMKLRTFQYGRIQRSRFNLTARSHDFNGPTYSSTTLMSAPDTGVSRSFVIAPGLSIPNSVNIGVCTESIAIPTTYEPTFLTDIFLPVGAGLVRGDTVTLNNGANRVVLVICRYDNVTGRTYAFVSVWGGAGTFASWTAKKEKLHYWFRDNDEYYQNFYCTVQTYNPSTGDITVLGVSKVGGASVTNWAGVPGKQQPTPTGDSSYFNWTTPNSAYGSFVTGTFYGTGIVNRSQTDNRGTGIRYIYAGGPLIDNPPADVVVDLYSASFAATSPTVAFNNLSAPGKPGSEHHYIGVAVRSPSGVSANTYFWVDAHPTIPGSTFDSWNFDKFIADPIKGYIGFVGDPQAAGEGIFIYKDNNFLGDIKNTWPFHNFHAENNLTLSITVDGLVILPEAFENILDNPYLFNYKQISSCVVDQSGSMIHESRPGDFFTYVTRHTLNKYGLRYVIDAEASRDNFTEQLYSILVEMSESFFTGGDVLSDNGQVMAAPLTRGVQVALASNFAYQKGYVARGSHGMALGWYYDYMPDMWRQGLANEGPHHLELRDLPTGGFKFRTYPMFNGVILAGTKIKLAGRLYVGNKGTI